jgi:histidinol-phosphate aminotransferase
MPEPKKFLADLHRTKPLDYSRHHYLRLDMNEGVSGLPAAFVRRTLAAVDGDWLSAYPEYRPLQDMLARHNGLAPEHLILSNGSDAAIKYIFDAYVSAGDRVLLTDPTFAMYPVYCRMFGAEAISVPYRPDLSFPWEEFIGRLVPGVRLAAVVNPNNPTGDALPRARLLELTDRADRCRTLLLVDEAYFYYYPETVIQAVKDFQNLVVLRTFSKLCGMATLRLGYAAACPEVIENLRKVRPTFDVNGLAVLFGEKLLGEPEIIQEMIQKDREGKDFLVQKLAAAGIPHHPGKANFVLINCHGRVEKIIRALADEGILVSGGFKNEFLQDYIRVTTGSRTVMMKFWQVFSRIWGAQDA